jgi:hypothetical protein
MGKRQAAGSDGGGIQPYLSVGKGRCKPFSYLTTALAPSGDLTCVCYGLPE